MVSQILYSATLLPTLNLITPTFACIYLLLTILNLQPGISTLSNTKSA